MAQVLEDTNLLLDHVFVPFDSLLENNLDSHINTSVQGLGELDCAVGSGSCKKVQTRKMKSARQGVHMELCQ